MMKEQGCAHATRFERGLGTKFSLASQGWKRSVSLDVDKAQTRAGAGSNASHEDTKIEVPQRQAEPGILNLSFFVRFVSSW